MDLPLAGYSFTWSKSRGRENAVEEHLDRAFVNQGWLDLFPNATLTNLLATYSDHSLILLQCDNDHHIRAAFSFKFEISWLREDGIEEVFGNGWCRREYAEVTSCIPSCPSELVSWNKRKYRNQKEAKAGYSATMVLYSGGQDTVSPTHFMEAQREYNKLIFNEEIF